MNNPTLHPLYAMEYWQLKALFQDDPTITIKDIDAKNKTCYITCSTSRKAELLQAFLNPRQLKVVIDVDHTNTSTVEDLFDELMADNPLYAGVVTVEGSDGVRYSANEFKPIVTHFFSDDAFSPTGHTAILPQDLARRLFHGAGLNFQTDLTEDDCCPCCPYQEEDIDD